MQYALQKKRHIRDILGRTNFFCHTYDTSMTIIVTKPGIIVDVVGSYFYDKKSWQKMGFSSWACRRRSCMTFFGPSMTEKTVVEARARKISGCSRLWWVVGAERCVFLSYTYARVWKALGSNWTRARHWALTVPERLHCRLRVTELERLHCRLRITEPKRSIDPLLLIEPEWFLHCCY